MVGMEPVAERPGGGNRYFEDLRRALVDLGARPHALLLSTSAPDGASLTAVGRPDDSALIRVLAFAREISRQADHMDVLNTHFAMYGIAALLTRRGRRLPLVVNFQGPWAAESALAQAPGRTRLAAKKLIERLHYRQATALVALSQEFADILVTSYGVPRERISVIPPGVDLEAFHPGEAAVARRALGLPEHGFIALAVRRLTGRMGLEQLIRAWASVPPEAVLLLAGEGDGRARLERLVEELGLSPRIRLLGRVPDADLPRLYQAADLCVVPSLALEGFGLTVLESLASGTPVVATATGGMAEVLPRLSRDCLVPPGDVEALAARIARAVTRPQDEPAQDDCRRFAESFSWPSRGGAVLSVFERAARRTAGG